MASQSSETVNQIFIQSVLSLVLTDVYEKNKESDSNSRNAIYNFLFLHFLQTLIFRKSKIYAALDFMYLLAWEPSAAQVTHSYSRHLPALERFYRETKFSLLKSTHST